ncbi:MAG: choice-of-anchor B family protein [Rhodothermales bacterium]
MKTIRGILLLLMCFFLQTNDLLAQGFGGSMALAEHNLFVGEANNNNFPGSVYVYADDEKPGTWIETMQLEPEDGFPGDRFGQALAADGNMLVVGMSGYQESVGAVLVYTRSDDGSWMEKTRVMAQAGLPDDRFGNKVALSGDLVAVAAPGRNNRKGGVFMFRQNGDSWQQEAFIEGTDTAEGDVFGTALALNEGMLLVGAPAHNEAKGAAYLFHKNAETGAWEQKDKLVVPNIEEKTQFGQIVALTNGTAYISAPRADNRKGAVYAFPTEKAANARGAQYQLLTAYDGQRNGRFGASILASNDELWIGAPGDMRIGSAYLFTNHGPQGWTSVTKMTGDELSGRASFGAAMLRNQNVAVFGATGIDGGEGAAFIFAKNEESNAWAQKLRVINEVKGLDAITGEEIKCEGEKAAGFDCKGVSLMSFLPIKAMGGGRGVRVNDIWGWTDPQTDKEYALIGRTDGTSFVDVTDPNNPVYVGQLSKTEGSRASIWRDVKVYKDHAFIVADASGQHGMQVFDLAKLRSFSNEPIDFKEDAIYDNIASAHNVVINESTGFAYAVGSSSGGETCGGGLHMINIQDPKQPTFSGCFADTETGRNKTGYSHDAQCVVYQGPDADHQGKEICFGSNETAMSIADVSDKENPKALAVISYPKVVYAHQGWLTEDHRYFYMNDEGDEPTNAVEGTRTLVWDVADLDDPILVKEHIAETTSTDHNLYIRGDLMYQSNYDSGFRVLDISNPENPVEVGFLDTTPFAGGGGGSWSNYPYFKSGSIIVTSMQEGLFVVKKEDVAF